MFRFMLCSALLALPACDAPAPRAADARVVADPYDDTRDRGSKTDICHVTGDGSIVELNISTAAVAKHFANHGDYYPIEFYEDFDGDGYGDAGVPTTECEAPTGYVEDDSDCDDDDASVSPDAEEICDGIDNDCDGDIDEDDVCTSCTCDTPDSFFEAFITGAVTLTPGVNGFCSNSGSTALAFLNTSGIAAGGEAGSSGSGNWACESNAGYPGDVGFVSGLSEAEGRACGDLVRDAMIAQGISVGSQCSAW